MTAWLGRRGSICFLDEQARKLELTTFSLVPRSTMVPCLLSFVAVRCSLFGVAFVVYSLLPGVSSSPSSCGLTTY